MDTPNFLKSYSSYKSIKERCDMQIEAVDSPFSLPAHSLTHHVLPFLTHSSNKRLLSSVCQEIARRGTERLIRLDLAIDKFTPTKKQSPEDMVVAQYETRTGMWASGALRKCHGLAAGHFLCATNVS